MTDLFLYFLLLGAVGLGWVLGRRAYSSQRNKSSSSSRLTRKLPVDDYFVGLNYLLNDEPDDAIDHFIASLEVNSGTLETHMALGTLLRRRGKVDRSIAVYQDLLGQNGFSHSQMNEIKINLIQSYIAAGLLDRAENLLGELRKEKGTIKKEALKHSAHVYQLEKEWKQGVEALLELLRFSTPGERVKYQNLASHFYCELAEIELGNEHMSQARGFLHLASGMDKGNPRVSMLRGKLESSCGNFSQAIKSYSLVKKQDPSFMADVFSPLVDCYRKAGKERALRKFIDASIKEETNTTVLLGLADFLLQEGREIEARDFLLEKLVQKPSLRLLLESMSLCASEGQSPAETEVKNLCQQVLGHYIENKAQYQCVNCGFELKSLHWQCPGCTRWGTVKHVMGILGE